MSTKRQNLEDKNILNYSIISKYRNQLMGIAIILIILLHFFQDVQSFNYSKSSLFNFSQYFDAIISSVGVDIFLLLSAIGLYFSLEKNNNLKVFYKKRFTRVVIPYVIIGGLYWLISDIFILRERND